MPSVRTESDCALLCCRRRARYHIIQDRTIDTAPLAYWGFDLLGGVARPGAVVDKIRQAYSPD